MSIVSSCDPFCASAAPIAKPLAFGDGVPLLEAPIKWRFSGRLLALG